MPPRPKRPCATTGCSALVEAGRCQRHGEAVKRERHRVSEAAREGSSTSRGYDWKWRMLRKKHLEEHPACPCGAPAEMVHHVNPVSLAPHLRLSTLNLASMCRRCHALEHARTGVATPAAGGARSPAAYPAKLGRFASQVVVVCGPPASGKSTFVRTRAKPGDVVLDLDEIGARLAGNDVHDDHRTVLAAALAERNDALFAAARAPGPPVWLISSAPRPAQRAFWRERGASVVEVMAPRAVCEERIRSERADVARHLAILARYFEQHAPDVGPGG